LERIDRFSAGHRSWLVTGASGRLGHRLCRRLAASGQRVLAQFLTHPIENSEIEPVRLDLGDATAVGKAFDALRPDVVVHTAGLSDVDACERDPEAARHQNVRCTDAVARAARRIEARLVHISTDQIWDGRTAWVTEETPPSPINGYARSKVDGERAVLGSGADALVVRTNFYGPGVPWRPSFSDWVCGALREGKPLKMFTDVFFTPIAVEPLCDAIADLVDADYRGVIHVGGSERLSKYDLGVALARAFGLPEEKIERSTLADVPLPAPRPKEMSMSTARAARLLGRPMPDTATCIATLHGETD
jgi:dTDP-4-dehydrorhamnose reductase